MNLKEAFDTAVVTSKTLPEKPSNEILLKMYSLFKQATEGDVTDERPGGFDFKAIAKYNAWEEQKGKSSDQAMEEYIQLINSLKG